jgi:hypothetical protein
MAKLRKRAVEVQAMQLKYHTIIQTEQGQREGRPGDWLIEGVEGEQYIASQSVVEKTYDILDDGRYYRKESQ